MTEFNAKIEIKNGQIYITPDDNYVEFDEFIWNNNSERIGDTINVLPF